MLLVSVSSSDAWCIAAISATSNMLCTATGDICGRYRKKSPCCNPRKILQSLGVAVTIVFISCKERNRSFCDSFAPHRGNSEPIEANSLSRSFGSLIAFFENCSITSPCGESRSIPAFDSRSRRVASLRGGHGHFLDFAGDPTCAVSGANGVASTANAAAEKEQSSANKDFV